MDLDWNANNHTKTKCFPKKIATTLLATAANSPWEKHRVSDAEQGDRYSASHKDVDQNSFKGPKAHCILPELVQLQPITQLTFLQLTTYPSPNLRITHHLNKTTQVRRMTAQSVQSPVCLTLIHTVQHVWFCFLLSMCTLAGLTAPHHCFLSSKSDSSTTVSGYRLFIFHGSMHNTVPKDPHSYSLNWNWRKWDHLWTDVPILI